MNLELLAPAGDKECFDVALNNGADAIYLGLSNFNARQKAQNFDETILKECVQKAHFFGVKVFVTLNSLVKNEEFREMLKAVKMAVGCKVDAFIVQDLGVVYALKKCFPNLNLHASTQLGIHNLQGAKVAEELGFSRIVLSRETKLEDIKAISKNTNLEIEYFVQGALCVAFSGNCYMSSFEYGASGNRGLCKQPCRMQYEMQTDDKKEKGYMLSARDLSLVSNLQELIDAGVCSFKIEGRLRRSGYVGQAVKSFRIALDNIKNNTKNNIEKQNLKKAFNRGEYLERAYLDSGVQDDVVNTKVQNHQGVEIGKVLNVSPFKDILKIEIVSNHDIAKGDGLKFFDGDRETISLGVGSFEKLGKNKYILFSKAKVKKGNKVFLILDKKLEKQILQNERKIKISIDVQAKENLPFCVGANFGNLRIEYKSDFVVEKAQNKNTSLEEIQKQVAKVGGTDFEVEKVSVVAGNVFLPKSVINNARRCLLEKLSNKMVENQNPKVDVLDDKIEEIVAEIKKLNQKCDIDSNNKNADMVFDVFSLDKDIRNKKYVLIKISNFQKGYQKIINEAVMKNPNAKLAVELPIVANGKDIKVLNEFLKFASKKVNFVISNNIFGFGIEKHDMNVLAGFGHNAYNTLTGQQLAKMGAVGIFKSIEVAQDISLRNEFFINDFEIPLMTFAHCPYKTLYKNKCEKCSCSSNLTLKNRNKLYKIKKIKLDNCYFQLFKK